MTDRGQPSPSPSVRPSPQILPPLSKFYYGPTQGWNSADASPSLNDSAWSLNRGSPHLDNAPSLPSRPAPTPAPSTTVHWQGQLAATAEEESQAWQSEALTTAAVTAESSFITHSMAQGRDYSPVNPGWDSRPTSSSMDTSTWGVNYNRIHLNDYDSSSKPLLPPRRPKTNQENVLPGSAPSQHSPHSKYSSNHPSARGSATTIDVPLFLQSQLLDHETAPPLPKRPSPSQPTSDPVYPPPPPQRQPPPPSKTPLHLHESQAERYPMQRPQYDPQNSFGAGHLRQGSQSSLRSTGSQERPKFDPHDRGNQGVLHRSDLRPSLPTPQFTSFDIKTALPKGLRDSAHEPYSVQQPMILNGNDQMDEDHVRQMVQMLPQDSISPINDTDTRPKPNRWDAQPGYVPSPEPRHTALPLQDGQSTSATDTSSNRLAASTPESQQTSNTSYRENEVVAEQSLHEDESNKSFYWHSGRSSSEGEDGGSHETMTATPDPVRKSTEGGKIYDDRGLPKRSTSLSPNPPVSYGASALGFGGPSDWEYFGDYEAEEIDDEELYAHKPRAELPTEYHDKPVDESTPEPELARSGLNVRSRSQLRLQRPASQPPGHMREDGYVLESRWSPATTTPTTPHADSSRPLTVTSEPMPPDDQRPDLEEIIRAWSDAPYVGKSSGTNSLHKLGQRHYDSHGNPGEASLASTPGENVLGVHGVPQDAPPMPKLPDTFGKGLEITTTAGDEPIQALAPGTRYEGGQDCAPDDLRRALESHIKAEGKNVHKSEAENGIIVDSKQDTGSSSGLVLPVQSSFVFDVDSSRGAYTGSSKDTILSTKAFDHAKVVPKQTWKGMDGVNTSEDDSHQASDMLAPSSERVTLSKVDEASILDETSGKEHRHDTVLMMRDAPSENITSQSPPATNSKHIVSSRRSLTSTNSADDQGSVLPDTSTGHEMKRPSVAVDIPRTKVEKSDSPSSDFARKRQMFGSPAEKKSSPSPFLRKPLKESNSVPESADAVKPGGPSVEPMEHKMLVTTQDEPQHALSDAPTESIGHLRDLPEPLKDRPSEHIMTLNDTVNASVEADLLVQTIEELSDSVPQGIEPGSDPPNALLPQIDASEAVPAATVDHIDLFSMNKSDSVPDKSARANANDGGLHDSLTLSEGDASRLHTRNCLSQGIIASSASEQPKPPIMPSLDGARDVTGIANNIMHDVIPSREPSTPGEGSQADAEEGFNGVDGSHNEGATQHMDNKATITTPAASTDKSDDPYADLDPWGRASLNRFAAMLREEARMEFNKDKLNIFNVFASRESRLRVVLYGTEDELILPTAKAPSKAAERIITQPHRDSSQKVLHLARVGSSKRAAPQDGTAKHQRFVKELPPLPPNRNSVLVQAPKGLTSLVLDGDGEAAQIDPALQGPDLDSQQYSPGGRPIVKRLSRSSKGVEEHSEEDPRAPLMGNSSAVVDISEDQKKPKPANPDVSQVEKPAFARPRPGDGGSEVKNYLTNRRSIYRPFATQTMESMENAIKFGGEPVPDISQPPVPAIVAPRSQYSSLPPVSGNLSDPTKAPSSKIEETPRDQPLDLRHFIDADFDPLIMVLPQSEAALEDSVRLTDFNSIMESVPDDFSFIHAGVLAWDAKVKNQREQNDKQRHVRQIESEQRIDALFDDHEIGYGDIAELEGEFKRAEAAIKAEEDRWEYRVFIEDVFNMVWTRLHYELDQLLPHYELYTNLMNDTLAGREMFESSQHGLALAPTMTAFLVLHQKIEIRHQKAFEAVLERDRRLKKKEISPWYTLSNIPKVKQLEKQFEDAEKKAIIEYCQQRDQRANRLMDVLDQNTLRGVGSNQDYMEAIMKAVRRIASGRAFASVPDSDCPRGGIDLVQKAKAIASLLASSSEQIVQTFHVADMLLNSADYEVSVAKAKISKADMATLAKLKEEKAKEDQKLMRDLEHRLALIREDTRRTNDEIIKLMLFLGVQSGRAINAQPMAPALEVQQQATAGAKDADHEARMQRALEEAKRRNAVKDEP